MNKQSGITRPIIPLLCVIALSVALKLSYIGPWTTKEGGPTLMASLYFLLHIMVLFAFHLIILLATLTWGYDESFSKISQQRTKYRFASWLYVCSSILLEYFMQTLAFPKSLSLSSDYQHIYTLVLFCGVLVGFFWGGWGGGRMSVSYPKWLQKKTASSVGAQKA